MNALPPFIAISRLGAAQGSRIVHLPTAVLLPTPEWSTDTTIIEEFEFDAPPELAPGIYPIQVAWYSTVEPDAWRTSPHHQIGEMIQIGQVEIP